MTNDFHEREDYDGGPGQCAGGGDGSRRRDGAWQIEAYGAGGDSPDRDPVEEAERGDAGKDRGDDGGETEKLHDALIEQLLAQQSKPNPSSSSTWASPRNANAVIGVSFGYENQNGMLMVSVSGTAVVFYDGKSRKLKGRSLMLKG